MIDYRHPARRTSAAPAPVIDYSRPDRVRTEPTPDADGIVRLRRGESITLRA